MGELPYDLKKIPQKKLSGTITKGGHLKMNFSMGLNIMKQEIKCMLK